MMIPISKLREMNPHVNRQEADMPQGEGTTIEVVEVVMGAEGVAMAVDVEDTMPAEVVDTGMAMTKPIMRDR